MTQLVDQAWPPHLPSEAPRQIKQIKRSLVASHKSDKSTTGRTQMPLQLQKLGGGIFEGGDK